MRSSGTCRVRVISRDTENNFTSSQVITLSVGTWISFPLTVLCAASVIKTTFNRISLSLETISMHYYSSALLNYNVYIRSVPEQL